MPTQPLSDEELQQKVWILADNYVTTHEQADKLTDDLMQLIRQDREAERQFTWQLINDVRYQNISLEHARNQALDRLTEVQVQQDLQRLTHKQKEKE